MANSIFSADALKKVTDETIKDANLPDGHTNAVVFGVDEEGAKVVAHFVLGKNDHWSLDGVYQHEWSGDNKIGGDVAFSW